MCSAFAIGENGMKIAHSIKGYDELMVYGRSGVRRNPRTSGQFTRKKQKRTYNRLKISGMKVYLRYGGFNQTFGYSPTPTSWDYCIITNIQLSAFDHRTTKVGITRKKFSEKQDEEIRNDIKILVEISLGNFRVFTKCCPHLHGHHRGWREV